MCAWRTAATRLAVHAVHGCMAAIRAVLVTLPPSHPQQCSLKLPPYRSAQQIRAKLLYAVESGAGFELS